MTITSSLTIRLNTTKGEEKTETGIAIKLIRNGVVYSVSMTDLEEYEKAYLDIKKRA